jgi:hypothetical protein
MTVSTFSANWGSLLTLNVRDKWSFRPCLCQIRRNALLAESSGFGYAARAPVCRVAGVLLRRLPDHFLDFGRRDGGRPSRSWCGFIQRRQTTVEKPVPPARCLLRHNSQFGRNLLILHFIRGQQVIWARSTLRAEALRARARSSSISRCSVLSTTGRATRIVLVLPFVRTRRK